MEISQGDCIRCYTVNVAMDVRLMGQLPQGPAGIPTLIVVHKGIVL